MRLQTDHWVGYTRQVFPSVSNFETGALLVGLQDLELMLWEVSPLFFGHKTNVSLLERARGGSGPCWVQGCLGDELCPSPEKPS